MPEYQPAQAPADRPDLVLPGMARRRRGHRGQQVVAHRVVQVVLAAEVGVEGHWADTQLGGQGAEAETVRAAGLHQVEGRPYDQLLAERGPRCPRALPGRGRQRCGGHDRLLECDEDHLVQLYRTLYSTS